MSLSVMYMFLTFVLSDRQEIFWPINSWKSIRKKLLQNSRAEKNIRCLLQPFILYVKKLRPREMKYLQNIKLYIKEKITFFTEIF